MIESLGLEQKKIINLSKSYLKAEENKGIKIEISPIF